jgi:hypothetical protein
MCLLGVVLVIVSSSRWDLQWGVVVVIIVLNIRSGSHFRHQVLVLPVAMHQIIFTILPLLHLGAGRLGCHHLFNLCTWTWRPQMQPTASLQWRLCQFHPGMVATVGGKG